VIVTVRKSTNSLLQKESDVLKEIDTVYKTLFSDDYKMVTLSEARNMLYQLEELYRELFYIKKLLHQIELERASGTIPPWE